MIVNFTFNIKEDKKRKAVELLDYDCEYDEDYEPNEEDLSESEDSDDDSEEED